MAFPQPPSLEDKIKEWDSVPLFMQSLPGPDEDVNDTAISALQSLAHEGIPDEIAQNFKEQGNEYFKGKRYREALGFYNQGIDAKPEDPKLLELLLCNRAACNLELKNYGSVLRDCARAIVLNSECSKAYYRSAQALLVLERMDDALDACQRCLNFDPANDGTKTLRDRIVKAKRVKEEMKRVRAMQTKREARERERFKRAFRERGLIEVPDPSSSAGSDHKPHFEDDTESSALILPSFFLYPQYAESDIVPNFHEDTTFGDQLSSMFPPNVLAPGWDLKHEYMYGKLNVYVITRTKRLLKVGMKMTLRDLLNVAKVKDATPDGLEVREGYLSFVVVPKGEVEQRWVDELKKIRDRDS
ncbi:CNS1 [Sanghuangporus weigelae]